MDIELMALWLRAKLEERPWLVKILVKSLNLLAKVVSIITLPFRLLRDLFK